MKKLSILLVWKFPTSFSFTSESSDSKLNPSIVDCLKFGAGMFFVVTSLIPPGLAQV